jgi:hypothetical protein
MLIPLARRAEELTTAANAALMVHDGGAGKIVCSSEGMRPPGLLCFVPWPWYA